MGLADQVRVVKRFAASDVDADCESDRGGIPSGAAGAGDGDSGDAREFGTGARGRGEICAVVPQRKPRAPSGVVVGW